MDASAHDHLTKPFATDELLAHIRVVMGRTTQSSIGPIYSDGRLAADLDRCLVRGHGREVLLSSTEYDLLKVLVLLARRTLTHRQLLQPVWGPGYDQADGLLRATVGHLRRKLEPDPARPRLIVTEPGVGYRLRTSR